MYKNVINRFQYSHQYSSAISFLGFRKKKQRTLPIGLKRFCFAESSRVIQSYHKERRPGPNTRSTPRNSCFLNERTEVMKNNNFFTFFYPKYI